MRDASDEFKAALLNHPNLLQAITATIPDGDTIDLLLASPLSVTASSGTGPRLQAQGIAVLSEDVAARDLWELLSRPGVTFDASVGQRLSGTSTEWVSIFHGYASKGSTRIIEAAVVFDAVDPWAWVEGVPFFEPLVMTSTRASIISAIVSEVLPLCEIVVLTDGGSVAHDGLAVNQTRTQTIAALAADGNLDAAFDGSPGSGGQGRFVIKANPEVDSNIPAVEQLQTGVAGTILLGSGVRSRSLGRIYNAVTVIPDDPELTWTAQTVRLSDTGSPYHEDKIGFRPYEYRSKTIGSASEALTVARGQLQKLLKRPETIDVSVVVNPLLEVGDGVDIITAATATDPGLHATYLISDIDSDYGEGRSTIKGTTSTFYDTEAG